jgi:hypothetical protein
LGLKQVGSGELGVVRYGVSTTYFKLDPQTATSRAFSQHHIRPRGVTEDTFQFPR